MTSERSTDKIYDRCSYLNCYNGKYSTGHRLFRFPAYGDSRHRLWIRYTGNIRLRTWSSVTIRRAGICADHFAPESFTDSTRRSLRRYAVPKPYGIKKDDQAKPSTILLARVRSLSREQTRSRNNTESQQEIVDNSSSPSSAVDEEKEEEEKEEEPLSMLDELALAQEHIVEAFKPLPKLKTINIEEQNLNSRNTVISTRFNNPDEFLIFHRSSEINDTSNSYIHKISVNDSRATTTTTTTTTRCDIREDEPTIEQNFEFNGVESYDSLDKMFDEDVIEEISNEAHRVESHRVNVTKIIAVEESSKSENRESNNLPAGASVIARYVQGESLDATKAAIPQHILKKYPLTTELVDEYFRTRKERACDRCAYNNCKNSKSNGARLFRFPQKKDDRAKIWIRNTGNPRILYWSWSTIRRAGLCVDHFTTESFFNETRHRLLRSAVPIKFNGKTETSLLNNHRRGKKKSVIDEPENLPIDLPDNSIFDNGDKHKMRLFHDSEEIITEMRNNEREEKICKNLTSAKLKFETSDFTEKIDDDRSFQRYSNIISVARDEIEEDDSMDITSCKSENFITTNEQRDYEDNDENTGKLVILQRQKAELSKCIEKFSAKLENAKIRKNKLRSQLLACTENYKKII